MGNLSFAGHSVSADTAAGQAVFIAQAEAGCWGAFPELYCSVAAWEHGVVEMQSPQKVIAVQSLSVRTCGCV